MTPAQSAYVAWTAYMLDLRHRGRIWVWSINRPAARIAWTPNGMIKRD